MDPLDSSSLRYSIDNYPPLSVGKSLLILLASDEKSLLSLSFRHDAIDPVTYAFHSLHQHLLNKGSAVGSSICTPLLEKWVKTTNENKKTKILHIIRRLYEQHEHLFSSEFQKFLANDNKKHKLAVVQILQSLVNIICMSPIPLRSHQKNTKEKPLLIEEVTNEKQNEKNLTNNFDIPQISQFAISRILNLSQFIAPLVLCATTQSLVKDIQRIPTLLTVAAADCAINISYALALAEHTMRLRKEQWSEEAKDEDIDSVPSQALAEEIPSVFSCHLNELSQLIQEMIHWYTEPRPMFTVALKEIAEWINFHLTILFKQNLSIQEREALEKISVAVWILWAPFLMEDSPITSKKNIFKEAQRLLQHLQNSLEVDDDKKNELANETTTYWLICLCLLLGRMSTTSLSKLLKKFRETFYNILLQQVLHARSEKIQKLSICLLQSFIAHSDLFDAETLVDELLLFVQKERDNKTTKAVIGFLGELLVKYPKKITKLFASLDSNQKDERTTALEVLTEVFRLNRETLSFHPEVSEILGRELLSRLQDEELSLRTQAATLFAHLHPKEIIPQLVQMTVHRDVRVRSAADKALVTLLRQHKNIPQTVLTLLDSLRKLNADSSCSASAHATVEQQQIPKMIERIMKLLPSWAAEMPSHIFIEIIPETLKLFFNYPSESIFVKFLSALSPHFSQFPMLIFPEVTQKMRRQPKLSESISNGTEIQNIIFDQLAPLLVLKTLSIRAFQCFQVQETENKIHKRDKGYDLGESFSSNQVAVCEECVKLLLERMTLPLEFDEIRKVSAEICARFPPHLTFPAILSLLQHFVETRHIGIIKVLIYFVCHALIVHGVQTEQWIESLFPFLLQPLLWLSPQHTSPDHANTSQNIRKDQCSAMYSLQLGCIECLGFCLAIGLESQIKKKDQLCSGEPKENATQNLSKKPLIEVIAPESESTATSATSNKTTKDSSIFPDIVTNFSDILPFILKVIHLSPKNTIGSFVLSTEITNSNTDISQNKLATDKKSIYNSVYNCDDQTTALQLRLCLINALIICLQKLTKPQQDFLAISSISIIYRYYFEQANCSLKPAFLQFLFNLTFHLKERIQPFALDLYTICSDAMRNSENETRLGGLKVLGSLMTSVPETFLINSSYFLQTKTQLERIANIDSNKQCRELAEKLLCIAFPDQK